MCCYTRSAFSPKERKLLGVETPRSWAAIRGHEAVTRLLLQQDHIKIESTEYGRTYTTIVSGAKESQDCDGAARKRDYMTSKQIGRLSTDSCVYI